MMTKKLTLLALLAAIVALPSPARAAVECRFDNAVVPMPTNYNPLECAGMNPNAMLFDTATNQWTNPRTNTTFATLEQAQEADRQAQQQAQDAERQRLEYAAAAEQQRILQTQQQQNQTLLQSIQSTNSANAPFCGGASTNGACNYVPLEPLPVGNGAQNGRDFGAYVSGIFRIFITIGGLFAVVMLTVAGIGYMLSESALEIDKAKSRAKAALWGLMLLLGSWLILNTINPNLLRFDLLRSSISDLENLRTAGATNPSQPAATNAPTVPDPAAQAACTSAMGAYQAQPNGTYTCVLPSSPQ